MKKLIIGFAVFAMAACAQAASVIWSGGSSQTWTDSKGATIKEADVITMYVYEITATDYMMYANMDGTTLSKTIADLSTMPGTADGSANNTFKRGAASIEVTGTIDHVKGTATATAYALIVFEDNGNPGYVMANIAQKTIEGSSKVTVGDLYTTFGGAGSGGGATAWAAVPEPTSGLLLLVGMGALALRRKRG